MTVRLGILMLAIAGLGTAELPAQERPTGERVPGLAKVIEPPQLRAAPAIAQRMLPGPAMSDRMMPNAPVDGSMSYVPRVRPRRKVRDFSWIHVVEPQPREVKVHDIVTIVVDEKSEVTVNSRFNRQRNTTFKSELKEFIRFGETGNLETAGANQPTIDANLQSRLNSGGQMTDQEGIRYRIAATIVDVLPNGNIVLEARKTIRSNWDVWEYSLTGVIRSEDIRKDNTAASDNIANLNIVKTQRGKIYNSTKRPWGVVLYDWLSPF